MAEQKKYAGLEALTSLIQNIKAKYAELGHKHTSSDITDLKIPTKTSELTNDSNYITGSTVAGNSLGLVKSGGDVTINASGQIIVNDDSHNHTIANIDNLQSTLDSKVSTSRTINGKTLTGNITLSAADVNTYTKSEIDNLELITLSDIDTICGTEYQIASASEVTF